MKHTGDYRRGRRAEHEVVSAVKESPAHQFLEVPRMEVGGDAQGPALPVAAIDDDVESFLHLVAPFALVEVIEDQQIGIDEVGHQEEFGFLGFVGGIEPIHEFRSGFEDDAEAPGKEPAGQGCGKVGFPHSRRTEEEESPFPEEGFGIFQEGGSGLFHPFPGKEGVKGGLQEAFARFGGGKESADFLPAEHFLFLSHPFLFPFHFTLAAKQNPFPLKVDVLVKAGFQTQWTEVFTHDLCFPPFAKESLVRGGSIPYPKQDHPGAKGLLPSPFSPFLHEVFPYPFPFSLSAI